MCYLIHVLKTIVYDGKDEGSQIKWLSYAYNFYTIDYAMSTEITINYCYKWILAILVSMAFGGFLPWGPSWPFLVFIIFYMQS